ncbi:hypothetical protein F5Y06DRAFT_292515 [Hypoxylon sp. FL0890]|nr:hypothetical protein F5Y06DRAFT_292515 [Hypoxylon sp. FL0890]
MGESSDPKGKGKETDKGEQRPSAEIRDAPSTLHGFTLPDPNFDPSRNPFLQQHYKNKREKGALPPEDGIEDDIETEANRRIADWEKVMGRKATDEERERMTGKIRQVLSGSWLEGAKAQLVGKKEVPIAWFNRLVAENERCIGFVAQRMAGLSHERMETHRTIKELQDTIKKLEEDKSSGDADDDNCKEELEKKKAENAKLEGQNTKLQEDLTKSKSREKNLQEKNERVESELRAVHQQRRERDTKIEFLNTQLEESRGRETALKEEVKGHDKTVKDLMSENDTLRQRATTAEDSVRVLTDEKKALSEELQALKESKGESSDPAGDAETTKPKSDPEAPVNFDTKKILGELKEAKQAGSEVSTEANELIDRWLSSVAGANNLREYHAAVDGIKENMAALRQRVVDLYKKMGSEEEGIDAEAIIDKLEALVDEQPNDNQTKMSVLVLKKQCDIQFMKQKLSLAKLGNQNLQAQLNMAKGDAEFEAEMRARHGTDTVSNEELDKRVDAKTQVYRQQRRDILNNIFGAANTLTTIAARCPDIPTREQIYEVNKKYLSPTSLPKPKPQPAR